MVTQSRPQIEHFARRESREWLYSRVDELEATVHIRSIDCELKLTDVYDRVVFPSDEELEEAV